MLKLLKSLAMRMGIDAKRLRPQSHFGYQVATIIQHGNYDLVFDVGANRGQFAQELRQFGYGGLIVSFEPLTEAHRYLSKAAETDKDWVVASRCALGAVAGRTEINVSGLHASSSLLKMRKLHENAAPGSEVIKRENVDVVRLDDVASAYFERSTKAFLKADTQGFELEVLRGAVKALDKIDGLLLELSLEELYEGQPLWMEVIEWLDERGFVLVALNQGFVDPSAMRTLQLDGVFMRKGYPSYASGNADI